MSLHHYRAVVNGKRFPFWWQSKNIKVTCDFQSLTARELWQIHDEILRDARSGKVREKRFEQQGKQASLLDLKVELAKRVYRSCTLCPLLCKVDRLGGEVGYCKLAANTRVFREGLLLSEEPFVIPTCELFVTGCNMRCVFCQSWTGITQPQVGVELTPSRLAQTVAMMRSKGATNVHFVGGEPTVNLLAILECLKAIETPLPLVWNTNLFATEEAMKLLEKVVDLFIADFKFGNDDCAQKLGGVKNYTSTVQTNLAKAERTASLVVRHLVMPCHIECCLEPVVSWVSRNLPNVTFHLMLNYVPDWKAWCDQKLQRRLIEMERDEAMKVVKSYRLKNVLVT